MDVDASGGGHTQHSHRQLHCTTERAAIKLNGRRQTKTQAQGDCALWDENIKYIKKEQPNDSRWPIIGQPNHAGNSTQKVIVVHCAARCTMALLTLASCESQPIDLVQTLQGRVTLGCCALTWVAEGDKEEEKKECKCKTQRCCFLNEVASQFVLIWQDCSNPAPWLRLTNLAKYRLQTLRCKACASLSYAL
jgi:hypothetical protein